MYAIVDIAGKQMKVKENSEIYTHTLNEKVGASLTLDKVLLIDYEENKKVVLGKPNIEGATVKAMLKNHVKADKVIVFKKKRRKGYKKTQGHRQGYSKILIQKINPATK